MSYEDDQGEHVVLLVDCSEDSWARVAELSSTEVPPTTRCSVKVALESAVLFESALKLFHADNRVTVIAASTEPKVVADVAACANEVCVGAPGCIVQGLSVALCVINRQQKDRTLGASSSTITMLSQDNTRVVIIAASPIVPQDFVTCMNCAFAAQKMNIVVDVLDCSQSKTPEYSQLVHHTDGWGLALPPKDTQVGSLGHALLSNFTVPVAARKYLNPPSCPATDLRTICYCHQDKLISMGYVCSVCLHVFCEKKNVCPACNSKVALVIKRRTS